MGRGWGGGEVCWCAPVGAKSCYDTNTKVMVTMKSRNAIYSAMKSKNGAKNKFKVTYM